MHNKYSFLFVGIFVISLFFSCTKEQKDDNQNISASVVDSSNLKTVATLFEDFEKSSKTAYSPSAITLTSGSWYFDDALIGTSSSDKKVGQRVVRLTNKGKITMLFDKTKGAGVVQLKSASFGSDESSNWELWMSVNSGSSWTKVGNTIATSNVLQTTSFTVNTTSAVRFEIRKVSGDVNRINIDDFAISDYTVTPTPADTSKIISPVTAVDDDNMMLGNPSSATSNIINSTNYLMVKQQYCLSYNNTKHTPNWTSWHLTSTDIGSAPRQDDFRADITLPSSWFQVSASGFSGSGFDRGHMCPSADRTSSVANNSATFLMINMIPQSPNNNQVTWANLENYSRSLINANNELYTISGPYGQGGTGSNGDASVIGNGIVVPAKTWKIIVVLSKGNNDISRITSTTRVIAVLMPNNQTVSSQPWGNYRVSVDAIESLTGFDFLSNVPSAIQGVIEAKVDNGPTQ